MIQHAPLPDLRGQRNKNGVQSVEKIIFPGEDPQVAEHRCRTIDAFVHLLKVLTKDHHSEMETVKQRDRQQREEKDPHTLGTGQSPDALSCQGIDSEKRDPRPVKVADTGHRKILVPRTQGKKKHGNERDLLFQLLPPAVKKGSHAEEKGSDGKKGQQRKNTVAVSRSAGQGDHTVGKLLPRPAAPALDHESENKSVTLSEVIPPCSGASQIECKKSAATPKASGVRNESIETQLCFSVGDASQEKGHGSGSKGDQTAGGTAQECGTGAETCPGKKCPLFRFKKAQLPLHTQQHEKEGVDT